MRMIIQLHSYVNPIKSTVGHNKEVVIKNETVQVESYILPIVTIAAVSKKQTKEVTSFVSHINSNVSLENISKKETIILISYIKHINAHTDVLAPPNTNVVFNAYLSHQENDSKALFIENRTFTEVIN